MADSNTLGTVGNGLGSKTWIVKLALTNMTEANLGSIYAGMGAAGHTVAGSGTADGSAFVSGTTDVLFIAVQGAEPTADASDAYGVTGAVTTIEAVIG